MLFRKSRAVLHGLFFQGLIMPIFIYPKKEASFFKMDA